MTLGRDNNSSWSLWISQLHVTSKRGSIYLGEVKDSRKENMDDMSSLKYLEKKQQTNDKSNSNTKPVDNSRI